MKKIYIAIISLLLSEAGLQAQEQDTVTLTIYRGGQYYAVDVILMDQALQ